jgi:hypothetical protein
MRSMTSNRGSVLIVALIFAAILAIALTSYMKLALNTGNLANRSFYFNAALNFIDTGFERAIWSLSDARFHAAPDNWTTHGGFTQISANEYYGTFPATNQYYMLSGNAKGQVRVRATVDNPSEPEPANYIWKTVAEATITLGDGTTLKKMALCYLRQRSYFGKGMVAKDGIEFNGNSGNIVDSWRSRYPTINDDVPYSTAVGVRRAEATIAAMKCVFLNNGDIYGYASIGSSTIGDNFTWKASNGTLNGATFVEKVVDLSRVTLDFSTNFPEVEPIPTPGSTLGAVNGSTAVTGNQIVGATSIKLQNNEIFEIGAVGTPANIVLVVSGNIDMSGHGSIVIYPGSSLVAYVGGDFKMTGSDASIQNGTTTVPANPDRCRILGTRTAAQITANQLQNWVFDGDGYLSAAVYAPRADIAMKGNGTIYGSVVGNTFKLNGNGAFHQDESLSRLLSSGIWGLDKWREITTAAERATYAAQLSFP